MTNTVVRARIDEYVKEEAAAVLATIGLTVSDAFRLTMVRIAKDSRDSFYRFRIFTTRRRTGAAGVVASQANLEKPDRPRAGPWARQNNDK